LISADVVENQKKRATTVKILTTAAAAIESILSDLAPCEVLQSAAKNQTETCKVIKEIEPNIPLKQAVLPHSIAISFKEVIGNFEAKQALYENVILPLTISDVAKVKIFSGKTSPFFSASHRIIFQSALFFTRMAGIRAGSGNVMLYGPAGTGKTIMCQAAAFEARAVLIIGESDGHYQNYDISNCYEVSGELNSYVWQI
jgi:SpoVK/Ycf46/Vps4 family AAA+-type ATPase